MQVRWTPTACNRPTLGPADPLYPSQVGRDARAQAFLGRLDKDPAVGDVIDCTSYFEQEAEEVGTGCVSGLAPVVWLCVHVCRNQSTAVLAACLSKSLLLAQSSI
jgi:hypothetical protein